MQAYKWFEESEEFKLKSDVIFKGLTYSNLVENIPRDLIKKLYADDNGRFMFSVSRLEKYAHLAVQNKCTVIDNSSFYRMNNDVPLIVPEVNFECAKTNKGIIANPNCSTIQAVVAVSPLDKKYNIKRIVYSTYQAVSGAGLGGIQDLESGIEHYVCNSKYTLQKFPYEIFNNCIPQIDDFTDDRYTKEEHKMINETRKILNKPNLPITATTVRVPVFNSHSESINIEFENDFDLDELVNVLKNSPGILPWFFSFFRPI